MNAQLTQAMEAAQRLPEDFQSAIATLITEAVQQPSDYLQEIKAYVRELIKRRKLTSA